MKKFVSTSMIVFVILFTGFLGATELKHATAVIQIHPGNVEAGSKYLENAMQSITAEKTLGLAVKSIGLQADDAVANLKKKVSTSAIRGTDLIQINVQGADPKEAAKIANAVANAYITRTRDAEVKRAKAALQILETELEEQNDFVEEYRKELTVLIQQYGLPYFEMSRKENLQSQSLQTRIEVLEKVIAQLETAEPHEKIAIAASIDLNGNPAGEILKAYRDSLIELDFLSLKSDGETQNIIEARKKVQEARSKIPQAVKSTIKMTEKRLAQLRIAKPSEKKDEVRKSLEQHEYFLAREAYEQSRQLLQKMKLKQQEQRVRLKNPRRSATLHEAAK